MLLLESFLSPPVGCWTGYRFCLLLSDRTPLWCRCIHSAHPRPQAEQQLGRRQLGLNPLQGSAQQHVLSTARSPHALHVASMTATWEWMESCLCFGLLLKLTKLNSSSLCSAKPDWRYAGLCRKTVDNLATSAGCLHVCKIATASSMLQCCECDCLAGLCGCWTQQWMQWSTLDYNETEAGE